MACIKNKYWDEKAFLDMLKWASTQNNRPLFVSVPDVVGNSTETIIQYSLWEPVVLSFRLNPAFVMQDGMSVDDIPSGCQHVFIGGTDYFKWSGIIEKVRKEVNWLHVGRVNNVYRLDYCHRIGVDSIDGTGWFRDPSDWKRSFRGIESFLDGSINQNYILDIFDEKEREAK